MIRTIIVENEKHHSDFLSELLRKNYPEIDLMTICDNIPDAILKLKEIKPQLVFLDVELPPYTGFDLLEKTKELSYETIFTTSFNKYAVKAIKFCALDFLEKPFGLDELREAIDRFKSKSSTGSAKNVQVLLSNLKQTDKMSEVVGIPILGGIQFIKVSDIIRCQSSNNYTDFILVGKSKLTATKTLKWVNDLLQDHSFFRVHDTHLINLNHIKSYMKGGEGGVVLLTEGNEVDVARRRKEEFLATLTERKMIF